MSVVNDSRAGRLEWVWKNLLGRIATGEGNFFSSKTEVRSSLKMRNMTEVRPSLEMRSMTEHDRCMAFTGDVEDCAYGAKNDSLN